jgi:uridine monophosphate synthetase
MTFIDKLHRAAQQHGSWLCLSLDPSPAFLESAATADPDRSLADLGDWLRAIVAQTADLVCAYKVAIDPYLLFGAAGIALLEDLLHQAIPPEIPTILDAKHADWINSGLLARTAFDRWQVDAITIVPFSGQDHAAPFLLQADRTVFALCYTENPSARALQDPAPDAEPRYLSLAREVQTWGMPSQMGLEVEAADPEILSKLRAAAPEAPILLRGAWSGLGLQNTDYSRDLDATTLDRLDASLRQTLKAGLTPEGDSPIILIPRAALSHPQPRQQIQCLRDRLATAQQDVLGSIAEACPLWLPQPGDRPAGNPDAMAAPTEAIDPAHSTGHRNLILQLFDLGCILFGDYVQASGATFPYYVDLRQIISNPQVFHQILLAYAERVAPLPFDRLAGIPYGSLPTATGLALHLNRPMIFPRKEVKAHGTQRVVEGNFQPGERVVVVDDILISGKSAIEGIGKLESVGLHVTDLVVFIDHNTGAKERLAAKGYRSHAVLTLGEIAETLFTAGKIAESQYAALSAIE